MNDYAQLRDQVRGADEVMGRIYEYLCQAAEALTIEHPAADPVGFAIDYAAGWLSKPTVKIGSNG